jgi:DNA topoisomerase I
VRLRRSDPSRPGITRRGRGRGFEYFAPSGAKITDPAEVSRLRALAIPPAWRDVWICPDPNGHLQATGTDVAGRRQYRYHDVWRQRRDATKFDHMLVFARRLPQLRGYCVDLLEHRDGLDRARVLACAVRLLDHGFFRIGTERPVDDDDSVGLTTMRKEHVTIRERSLVEFDYLAKGGKRTIRQLADPAVVDIVGRLRRRRGGGRDLLAYRAPDGRWTSVTATDVNEVIKLHCGEDSSSKDFRTWNATVLAAVALAVSGAAGPSKKRAVRRACQEVAHYLGNTPAVTRASYIDPRVFDRFETGWTIGGALHTIGDAQFGVPAHQGEIERAVLDLLNEDTDADGVIAVDELADALGAAS